MEYKISFDEKLSLFLIQTTGDITIEDDRSCIEDLVTHPKWNQKYPLIVDRRKSTTKQLTANDMHLIADMVKEFGDRLGPTKIAIVMGTELDYGMGRMFEILTSGDVPFNMRICRSMEEAVSWIRQPNELV